MSVVLDSLGIEFNLPWLIYSILLYIYTVPFIHCWNFMFNVHKLMKFCSFYVFHIWSTLIAITGMWNCFAWIFPSIYGVVSAGKTSRQLRLSGVKRFNQFGQIYGVVGCGTDDRPRHNRSLPTIGPHILNGNAKKEIWYFWLQVPD